MTDQDELYFIKGDNPMCIYHYEKLGFYIYASTEPILKSALKQLKDPCNRAWDIPFPRRVYYACQRGRNRLEIRVVRKMVGQRS